MLSKEIIKKYLNKLGGGLWKAYHYTKEDKKWRKDGGKIGRKFKRSEKEMCERHSGNVFTKGKNSEYEGCGNGWCCAPQDSREQREREQREREQREREQR